MTRSEVERLRALVISDTRPDEATPARPYVLATIAEFEAAVDAKARVEEREAIAASCEAQAAVCATPARGGAYRHCARMARDVAARVGGGGGA